MVDQIVEVVVAAQRRAEANSMEAEPLPNDAIAVLRYHQLRDFAKLVGEAAQESQGKCEVAELVMRALAQPELLKLFPYLAGRPIDVLRDYYSKRVPQVANA